MVKTRVLNGFKFPCITPGYLGIKSKTLTLNAAFYANLLNDNHLLNKHILFPQRIPKKELFDEIIFIENKDIAQLIKKKQMSLVKKFNSSIQSTNDSCINWLNLLLRLGLSNKIIGTDFPKLINTNRSLELKLIKIIGNDVTSDLSDNLLSKNLENLGNIVLTNKKLNLRIQILILNYLIVSAYRFAAKFPSFFLRKCYQHLLALLSQKYCDRDAGTLLRKSIAYRGLAMINELDILTRNEYLNKSELIARSIPFNNFLEELVVKENLYTCLQTLSKWNLQLNRLERAEDNLREMIEIDPFDSTGHGEFAFFLLNHERTEEASHYFKNAAKLGPPGVGMHTYFYAKTLRNMGKIHETIDALYECTKLDTQAVSPWLELFEIYLEMEEPNKVKKVVSVILNNLLYKEQLEKKELAKLSKFIN